MERQCFVVQLGLLVCQASRLQGPHGGPQLPPLPRPRRGGPHALAADAAAREAPQRRLGHAHHRLPPHPRVEVGRRGEVPHLREIPGPLLGVRLRLLRRRRPGRPPLRAAPGPRARPPGAPARRADPPGLARGPLGGPRAGPAGQAGRGLGRGTRQEPDLLPPQLRRGSGGVARRLRRADDRGAARGGGERRGERLRQRQAAAPRLRNALGGRAAGPRGGPRGRGRRAARGGPRAREGDRGAEVSRGHDHRPPLALRALAERPEDSRQVLRAAPGVLLGRGPRGRRDPDLRSGGRPAEAQAAGLEGGLLPRPGAERPAEGRGGGGGGGGARLERKKLGRRGGSGGGGGRRR
mmetsp:Transcript_70312/g.177186  ORF Transcript_70312/g.177186 Transcript_70312/m.177186 type:complete len:351 (+) Transcript_70312:1252-2304(+)